MQKEQCGTIHLIQVYSVKALPFNENLDLTKYDQCFSRNTHTCMCIILSGLLFHHVAAMKSLYKISFNVFEIFQIHI